MHLSEADPSDVERSVIAKCHRVGLGVTRLKHRHVLRQLRSEFEVADERIVVAVGDEDGDSLFSEAAQSTGETHLSRNVSLGVVVHISSENHDFDTLIDREINEVLVGAGCMVTDTIGCPLVQLVAKGLEGCAEMKVGCMKNRPDSPICCAIHNESLAHA
jgi:hypothetical protein